MSKTQKLKAIMDRVTEELGGFEECDRVVRDFMSGGGSDSLTEQQRLIIQKGQADCKQIIYECEECGGTGDGLDTEQCQVCGGNGKCL